MDFLRSFSSCILSSILRFLQSLASSRLLNALSFVTMRSAIACLAAIMFMPPEMIVTCFKSYSRNCFLRELLNVKKKAPAEAGALEKGYESGWKGGDINDWNQVE